jgi:hypothetical protein
MCRCPTPPRAPRRPTLVSRSRRPTRSRRTTTRHPRRCCRCRRTRRPTTPPPPSPTIRSMSSYVQPAPHLVHIPQVVCTMPLLAAADLRMAWLDSPVWPPQACLQQIAQLFLRLETVLLIFCNLLHVSASADKVTRSFRAWCRCRCTRRSTSLCPS